MQAMALHIHTQDRFNNHTAHSLFRIMVTATTVTAGLEPTSQTFQASVLPLQHAGFPDVTAKSISTCLCSSLPQRSVQTPTDLTKLLETGLLCISGVRSKPDYYSTSPHCQSRCVAGIIISVVRV